MSVSDGSVTRSPKTASRSSLFGLMNRRERWGLSLRGWVLILLALSGVALTLFFATYRFLAVNQPVPGAEVLVVEGWVPNFAIKAAQREIAAGNYKKVYVTGGPLSGDGGYTNEYNTSASVGAGNLRAAGVPEELLQMVPSRVNDRDRTFGSAVALREWFREHAIAVHSFDILTENTHARRTRLLFQKAFGDEALVGIIAIDNPDYDPDRWWKSSEGVKNLFVEAVAYVYAKLLFWPSR